MKKGQKKDSDTVELTMSILRYDYAPIVQLLVERKAMIEAMPEGKERKFLQADYDEYALTIANHLDFKKNLMKSRRIEGDAVTHKFPKAELDEMYLKMKEMHFTDNEERIPGAS